MLRVVFRTDASLDIGTGHVMRCLTLAKALSTAETECFFICRTHEGNMISYIREQGFQVHELASNSERSGNRLTVQCEPLAHDAWLGGTQEEDAENCLIFLKKLSPDWLILDHYALDYRWEGRLKKNYQNLFVIDDLADRKHICDLILDQTFGRESLDYGALVPKNCVILTGARYSLLRDEFSAWRQRSLNHRGKWQLKHLLINMGGVDKNNITCQILQSLSDSALPATCSITVVMGATSPWVELVKERAGRLPWKTDVKVGVGNMAELMAQSDLAIGAAGSTSWERCCLGLPSFLYVIAENQKLIASKLEESGAVKIFDNALALPNMINDLLQNCERELSAMSQKAAEITEGLGTSIVMQHMGLEQGT